jgi:hypothetical protein
MCVDCVQHLLESATDPNLDPHIVAVSNARGDESGLLRTPLSAHSGYAENTPHCTPIYGVQIASVAERHNFSKQDAIIFGNLVKILILVI